MRLVNLRNVVDRFRAHADFESMIDGAREQEGWPSERFCITRQTAGANCSPDGEIAPIRIVCVLLYRTQENITIEHP